MTGSVDPEEYLPKAIEKFKEAGIDTIIAEAQKQLNEWLASKDQQ
jgi:putative aldouronate transport system substrate-binding protein